MKSDSIELLDIRIHLAEDNDASFKENSFICHSTYIESSVSICKTEQIHIQQEYLRMKDILEDLHPNLHQDYDYE